MYLQHSASPAGHLLMTRQPGYQVNRREQPRPSLKKNGWVSQRFKPFPVELPSVNVKREKKRDRPQQSKSLTFDDLPKIRDKASTEETNAYQTSNFLKITVLRRRVPTLIWSHAHKHPGTQWKFVTILNLESPLLFHKFEETSGSWIQI